MARARTLPFGVEIRTQSPTVMPRAAAVSGWISTCGSGAVRRRLAMLRCWDSQNHSDFAQVRTSGKRSARSGRERGLIPRFVEGWQRRVAGGQERLRVQLDLAGGRAEPARCRVLAVAGRQRHPDAGRVGTQLLEGDAAGSELVPERGVDVAAEELLAEPEPRRQREDDLQVRAGLAPGCGQRCAELDERLRVLAGSRTRSAAPPPRTRWSPAGRCRRARRSGS